MSPGSSARRSRGRRSSRSGAGSASRWPVPLGNLAGGASWLDPRSGTVTAAGSLADVVHDGAGAQIGATSFVFGGGSPNTFATVQSLGARPRRTGTVAGQLPQPRSDLAAATIGRTVYLVGGYDGTTYEPSVLATDDGTHFATAATLKVPVRYPAVVALAATLFAFGGQTGQRRRQRGDGDGATFRRSIPRPTRPASSAPCPRRCTARRPS